jgi:Raf kinase inhibitor-like YbhB/YbcL family protein
MNREGLYAQLATGAICLVALAPSDCGDECPVGLPPTTRSSGEPAMQLKLTSTAFKPGAAIPRKYTGEGPDVSPSLSWDDPPAATRSFAIVCDDPDAPSAEPWIHWVIYNIGADVRALPEGIEAGKSSIAGPIAAEQGKNSWSSGTTVGYRGPMPPPGHGTHHYHFKLYALDTKLALQAPATKSALLDAIKGHVVGEGELVGTYERK